MSLIININNISNKVRSTVLTGLNTALTGTIAATDTVLQAFGKLQNQISGKQDDLGINPSGDPNKFLNEQGDWVTGGAGSQSLQDVTDIGNTTDNNIVFDTGAGINFTNGSKVTEGTTDAGNGGNKGVALKCSVDYELKWEAGRLYVMEQNGFTIREVSKNFNITPTINDDDTKGFVVGSRWILDDGSVYICTNSTTGAALWRLQLPNSRGLFAQTANSTPITGTNVETSLINGGVGTLSVPANGFAVGDSFTTILGGILNAANNQTIRIKVKSGSVILLDSGVQNISNITNDVFSLNLNFTIRQIGGTGTASIVSLGTFHYVKTSNATTQGFAFNVVNNTTFNTTIPNTLDITVQWGSNNATNSIYSDIFVLNKIY
jgi:hypothetical protein